MNNEEPQWVVVGAAQNYRSILDLELVLTAMGIDARVDRGPTGWILLTRIELEQNALDQLAKYNRENRFFSFKRAPSPVLENGIAGCIGYVVVLWTVWVLESLGVLSNLREGGVMWALAVRDGEWWRCFTALLFHADFVHLLGNSVFGVLFGLLVARYTGSGIAWLLIVVCGAYGNYLNALLQNDSFMSIGASTGVFAAAGLLCGLFTRRRFIANRGWRYNLIPIAGGIGLFAFLGIGGERTDIMAHLTGLFCGALAGLFVGSFDLRVLGKSGQYIAGVLTILVLLFALVLV